MIKHIPFPNPDVLAFKVINDLNEEDVEWLVKLVNKDYNLQEQQVLLYVEFEDFGELTLERMWEHLKLFFNHIFDLIKKVSRIAVVTSNQSLRDKLNIEFTLVPGIKYKGFEDGKRSRAMHWLDPDHYGRVVE
jgi:hypothetical protein